MEHAAVVASHTARRPTGTVTFLFTDIEGSTQRWEAHPAAMATALRRHDAIVRHAIEQHAGHVFKTIGDAFCAVFSTADAAIAAAIAAQRELASNDWDEVGDVRVRMAIHTGVTDEREDDYFGPTVNRVARILAAGSGGQILVSTASTALARSALPPEVTLRDLGEHRFRDLAQSERVYQIVAPGLADVFPPLRSVDAHRNNLPGQASTLIGRDEVIAGVAQVVTTSRLVTLVGTGGIGKTRVAIAAAAESIERFADGVWLVEFAPLGLPTLVPATVAAALGIRETTSGSIRAQILEYAKNRHMLLVFDNCEHVLGESAALAEAILRAAPQVSILATTREALNVSGEVIIRLPSLTVPPAGEPLEAAHALRYESIALFVDRARNVGARFALGDGEAAVIAEICRRLDGIALAIELAAVRTKVLGLNELNARLNERFRLLTGGDRTALPRQQTMRALIDWSYNLLSEDERAFLRSAAIFAGDWTLDAAEAVCAAGALDPLDLLTSLVEKSLIVADVETARFHLLESTRAYAREKLVASGELPAIARAHAAWVAGAVDARYDAYWTTAPQRWLAELGVEIGNVRAALTWALDPDGDVPLAARIAGALEGLWYNGAFYGEGKRWIETTLAVCDGGVPPTAIARLWLSLARLSVARGMVDAAQRAIALFDEIGDTLGRANGYHMLAVGLRRMGNLAEAEAAIEHGLRLFESIGATANWPYIVSLDVRAGILRFAGRIDEARIIRASALARFISLGDPHGAALIRLNLADLEALAGDTRRAIALSQEAALTFRAVGETAREATAIINIAAFHVLLDEFDAASDAARSGLTLALRAGWRQGIAIAIQHLGAIAAARGDAEHAARLLGFSDAWYRAESFAREPTEEAVYRAAIERLGALMDGVTLAARLFAGSLLTEADAVGEALRGA